MRDVDFRDQLRSQLERFQRHELWSSGTGYGTGRRERLSVESFDERDFAMDRNWGSTIPALIPASASAVSRATHAFNGEMPSRDPTDSLQYNGE